MNSIVISHRSPLQGTLEVNPDKSIALRALLLASISKGVSKIENPPSLRAFQRVTNVLSALSIPIHSTTQKELSIEGNAFQKPSHPLDIGNSATGARLLSGILWAQNFPSFLTGSHQLRQRPMERIIRPLSLMGARMESQNGRLPIQFSPPLFPKGLTYTLPIASAQVKSALFLASLVSHQRLELEEPIPSRDHTERMLLSLGVDLKKEGHTWILEPPSCLPSQNWWIPGDFSSSAYWIVAGLLVKDSQIILQNVGLNPSRTGLLRVIQRMGGEVYVEILGNRNGEPYGKIQIKGGQELKGTVILPEEVPLMIDEIPLIMILALKAKGETLLTGGKELRFKETDRLKVMIMELQNMGAKIEEREDGFRILGPQKLWGSEVNSHGDHRIAMSLGVASLLAKGASQIRGGDVVQESYPTFWKDLMSLQGEPQKC